MKPGSSGEDCISIESLTSFAVGAVPSAKADEYAIHLTECAHCEREFDSLRVLAANLAAWPKEVLQPSASLWDRLSARLPRQQEVPPLPAADLPGEVLWEEVSPGISCSILAADFVTDRVSMLVRLQPGVDYPAHEHADLEELHLLEGELWINDRKLLAGDYSRAEAGSADHRVWSETGCTCVLITSMRDRLLDQLAP